MSGIGLNRVCKPQKLEADYAFNVNQLLVKMNQRLNEDDITAMESQLKRSVEEDRMHWRVNAVKCDAIHTAKTYEEFADRVAAAHLLPLEKADFSHKVSRGWNQYAAPDPRE